MFFASHRLLANCLYPASQYIEYINIFLPMYLTYQYDIHSMIYQLIDMYRYMPFDLPSLIGFARSMREHSALCCASTIPHYVDMSQELGFKSECRVPCIWFRNFKIEVIKPWYHYWVLWEVHEFVKSWDDQECTVAKSCSNKSCWELNFLQKTQWAHIFISPRARPRGSKCWYVWKILLYWNGKVDTL